jgi:hypothetical protein
VLFFVNQINTSSTAFYLTFSLQSVVTTNAKYLPLLRCFKQTLDTVLRVKSDKDSSTTVWRYTELEPKELESVQIAAEKSGT